MEKPTLTILCFENNDLSPEYLQHYFAAMKLWNWDSADQAQIILISQKPDLSTAKAALERFPIEAELMLAGNEFVNGFPVWDVMKSIRQAWPKIRGQYVTFNHPEFIWLTGRVRRTCEWLRKQSPYLALGNLRRPARDDLTNRPIWRPGNCDKDISRRFSLPMRRGDYGGAAHLGESLPTVRWPLWNTFPSKPGATEWQEDVFFIAKDWAEAWQAFQLGGEMPFQDVYDVMGAAIKNLRARNLAPEILRMDMLTNRLIHLWHGKPYKSWNRDVREWFMKQPKRWKDSALLNPSIWAGLTAPPYFSLAHQDAKSRLRRGAGGTVTRYLEALDAHLNNSGGIKLAQFYHLNGKPKRNEHC